MTEIVYSRCHCDTPEKVEEIVSFWLQAAIGVRFGVRDNWLVVEVRDDLVGYKKEVGYNTECKP